MLNFCTRFPFTRFGNFHNSADMPRCNEWCWVAIELGDSGAVKLRGIIEYFRGIIVQNRSKVLSHMVPVTVPSFDNFSMKEPI